MLRSSPLYAEKALFPLQILQVGNRSVHQRAPRSEIIARPSCSTGQLIGISVSTRALLYMDAVGRESAEVVRQAARMAKMEWMMVIVCNGQGCEINEHGSCNPAASYAQHSTRLDSRLGGPRFHRTTTNPNYQHAGSRISDLDRDDRRNASARFRKNCRFFVRYLFYSC